MTYPLTREFLAGRLREHLSQNALTHIEDLIESVEEHGDNVQLVESGVSLDDSHLLIEGFVLRTIETGERRFIVGIHVPGDFIDLHRFALKRLDHTLVSAGSVRLGAVPHERLQTVMNERPDIARAMWFATLLDAAIHRRWIQALEQLDAPRRIAHLYAELHERLTMIGRQVPRALRTPFTQLDLADMCGVSAVHANRAVAKLRELGIGEIRRGDLYTDDWDALKRYARFDGSYLYGHGALKLQDD
ncbi:transcriptional regulator [Erythrobacter sp. QSSC1-22B]|uniref:Crp/Fnr family transcriptional regulator n=1 Tax=Erythrobacter sp. QSSC1-22B TaxID=1860125 RepID=UPI000805852B|nr:Crp/Fnr family transcriptional regulator [Erythrobacter sp. QSSC1-22B]OBX19520.1 transcriptional regulator [Erythrobacter sp. QSSC1-22B]